MSADTAVLNPVDAERKIQELSNRISSGVGVVTRAEREAKAKRRAFDLAYAQAYKRAEGSIKEREYDADIATMPHREEAEVKRWIDTMRSAGKVRRLPGLSCSKRTLLSLRPR